MSSASADLVSSLEALIRDRLGNWPPQWEGFHWPGYTYEHTLRVRNLALRLAREEGADPEVVEVAALLHDIAKAQGREHAAIGAAEAEEVLASLGAAPELAERACHAIATHSGDNTLEHPAENRVLGDADLIDANFGLVATWRFITIRAGRESTLEDTIAGMTEWLPKKDELMSLLRSDSGLAVARERSQTMHRACGEIAAAFNGRPAHLRELIEYIAGDYHRASLAQQVEAMAPLVRDEAAEGFRLRLLAEMNGEA